MLKELCHLHNLYAGQWKFGQASRIYISLVRWASRLEMLISTPEHVQEHQEKVLQISQQIIKKLLLEIGVSLRIDPETYPCGVTSHVISPIIHDISPFL